jgi:ubiquinone/menaquinone biosynthesis C-methylase UbiE
MSTTKNPFDSCSEQYSKFRPDYPPELIDTIHRRCAGTLIDVGAGTGKASAPQAARGLQVISIEPSLAMIGAGLRSYPNLVYVCSTAEELPLKASIAGAVTCAQAFHWLDAPRALKEFARVLKPGGSIFLFWNTRDLDSPAPGMYDALIQKWNPTHVQGYRRKDWGERIRESGLFEEITHQSFRQTQTMTIDDWIGLSRSISYIQSIGAEKVARFEAELIENLRKLADMDCPYITEMWSARKAMVG